ncbi:MAG TPA: hypothetical protein ENI07_15590 [Desulfobacterales bacterium]|nr:hypothetical protein [Desulfobacterales bacterium]
MPPDETRACHNCENSQLCFIRRNFDKAIHECFHFFDVEKKGVTPNYWQDILDTLAGCCVKYENKKEV